MICYKRQILLGDVIMEKKGGVCIWYAWERGQVHTVFGSDT